MCAVVEVVVTLFCDGTGFYATEFILWIVIEALHPGLIWWILRQRRWAWPMRGALLEDFDAIRSSVLDGTSFCVISRFLSQYIHQILHIL